MATQNKRGRKTVIRNLFIFAFVSISAGWVGVGLDTLAGTSRIEGPGQLLWIVAPLLTMALLRAFAGDGWADLGLRPQWKRNAVWYVFSLLMFPASAGLIVLIGVMAGAAILPDFSTARAVDFCRLALLGLLPSFLKNIFEEFAWRGYLAPRITAAGVSDISNHLLVGLVWAAWHIPYYLFFMDRTSFAAYNAQGVGLFFPMLFAGVLAMSFVYGEVRLLTRSVWPVLLLHTVSNAVGAPLLIQGFLRIAPGMDVVVSPGPGSFISVLLNLTLGFGLYRLRKNSVLTSP